MVKYKIDKRKFLALLFAGSIVIPCIGYANGIDAYYDGGYFVVQDYGDCKLSISKEKFNKMLDEDSPSVNLGDTIITIDKDELKKLIEIAEKHDEEMKQNYLLAGGLCGGTLFGTLYVSKVLSRKHSKYLIK